MKCGIRSPYPRRLNKCFGLKIQRITPDEFCSVQKSKRLDYDNNNEDECSNDVYSVNISSYVCVGIFSSMFKSSVCNLFLLGLLFRMGA